MKNEIREYLSDQPVYSKELESLFGLAGNEVRTIIHELREEGVPICSGYQGYWIARTSAELNSTIEHLQRREAGIRSVRQSLEKAKKSFCQMVIYL